MPLLQAVASVDAANSILDTSVITFIVNAAKEILGIMTVPPLGIYLTIGILGGVVGFVGSIVMIVRNGSHG